MRLWDRSLTGFLLSAGIVICALLLSATLQSLCCPLASVGNASLTLLLSLSDSNPAWLSTAITPHPGVELIKPAAIACPFAAVSHCPLAATKAAGQGLSPVSTDEALHKWYRKQLQPPHPVLWYICWAKDVLDRVPYDMARRCTAW